MTRDQGTRDDAEHSRWLDDQLKQPGMIDMRGMSAEQADAALRAQAQRARGRPARPKDVWHARAEEHRKLTGAARDRYHRYYMLSGKLVHGAAADAACVEAVKLATELRAEDGICARFDVFPSPLVPARRRPNRVVPGDYVALHADTMVGIVAAMACIEAERHDAVAAHAELMADFHAAIDRAVEYRIWKLKGEAPR